MSNIIKIEAYQTADGKIFHDERLAISHQAEIEIALCLDQNPLYGNHEGSRVEAKWLIDWIDDNHGVVIEFIKSRGYIK